MRTSAITALQVLLGIILITASPGELVAGQEGERFSTIPEMRFEAPRAPKLPSRRLTADPHLPDGAPSALMVEAAAITDGADTSMRLAIKANNANVLAYGVDDPKRIVSLTNLALTRLKAGRPEVALGDLKRVEELLEADRRPRDRRRVEAAYARGASYFQLGIARRAIEAFEDGLQLERAIGGLDGAGQVDFLRALVVSHQAIGDAKEADRWQLRRVEVAEGAYIQNADRLAWNYVDAGRWFRDAGRIEDAIALHGKAVEVMEARYGRLSPRLVGPLLDLSMSCAVLGPNAGAASFQADVTLGRSLRRAREVLALDVAGDPEQRLKSISKTADVHWILGRTVDAKQLYAMAAEIGEARGQGRYTALDRPAFLVFHPPRGADIDKLGPGNLVTQFSVDRTGKARRIDIVDGRPESFKARLKSPLVRAIRNATIRPRMVEGKPVSTEAVRYEYAAPDSVSDSRTRGRAG